jgi:hypothetical protein
LLLVHIAPGGSAAGIETAAVALLLVVVQFSWQQLLMVQLLMLRMVQLSRCQHK